MHLTDEDVSTSDVVSSYVSEAFSGVGSLKADTTAQNVLSLQASGTPLTKEEYKNSPYYRQTIPYSAAMTKESAKVMAEYNDDREANAIIINKASTAQSAIGLTSAFALGMFEPKNIAYGVAGAVMLGGVGGAAPVAANLHRISNLRKAAQVAGVRAKIGVAEYGALAGYGAVEGLVSAALMEPSNRDSASILAQDYTMSDSMWNVATSAAFGTIFRTAPVFISEKWRNYRAKAPDILMAEMDTAVNQLAQGKKVDVSLVERSSAGEVAKLPVAEQARAVEAVVRYTETPEFKARFEGSKVVDEAGAPLRVYHGTNRTFDKFEFDKNPNSLQLRGEGGYFTNTPHFAEMHIDEAEGANIRPAYLNLKNPLSVNPEELYKIRNNLEKPYGKDLTKAIQDLGHDGVVYHDPINRRTEYVAFHPDQIIPAFGEGKMNDIAKRIDNDNATALQKSIVDDLNDANDTAIDARAVAELEAYEEKLALEKDMAALDDYNAYMTEVAAMKKEGLLSEADEIEMLDALNSVNEKDLNKAYEAAYLCLTRG